MRRVLGGMGKVRKGCMQVVWEECGVKVRGYCGVTARRVGMESLWSRHAVAMESLWSRYGNELFGR